MPAWVKKAVQKRTIKVTYPAVVAFDTDPAYTQEIAAADSKRSYLNIESMDANITVKVWRHEGARPDLMRQVDVVGSPVVSATSAAVYPFDWTTPCGAASKCSVEISISAGSGFVTLEMDDVYRVGGG